MGTKGKHWKVKDTSKMNKSKLGKKISEEHRQKLIESHKGMHNSPKTEFKKGYVNPNTIKASKLRVGKKNHFFGKTHTKESITKMKNSEYHKDHKLEKHPLWQGGKSFEPYDKSFNNKFKRAIRKRDNQVCMLCGIHREKLKIAFAIHHINYDKKLSIPQNCISLCNSCHVKTNYNRKYWIKFFQSLLAEKYGYQYSNQDIIMGVKNEI